MQLHARARLGAREQRAEEGGQEARPAVLARRRRALRCSRCRRSRSRILRRGRSGGPPGERPRDLLEKEPHCGREGRAVARAQRGRKGRERRGLDLERRRDHPLQRHARVLVALAESARRAAPGGARGTLERPLLRGSRGCSRSRRTAPWCLSLSFSALGTATRAPGRQWMARVVEHVATIAAIAASARKDGGAAAAAAAAAGLVTRPCVRGRTTAARSRRPRAAPKPTLGRASCARTQRQGKF